ncbi:hypothetical protein ASPZODRAFT_133998 [Penicilliopsis zonata CBS 506.65]|uniref:Uncharacterized protein n=1 Tax=Penicilliopsis zonata CBS 506.65 TaxID=1073090 RepID=A0A1L9SDU6_9EURO|nr:hypothetical protein ASPZODRAFT_133998 [Penicilliopsis zonata CBS 506.65]OJJ45351.1 hypothetical protein ASPZODRAFT_133998 [Penicilliopsis zonata CBS 506.65]
MPATATKPEYPGGTTPINLLQVSLTANDPAPPQLGPVKDDLLDLLRRHRIRNVHVEIVNVDLALRPSLFFIPSTHPIVVAYEQVKHQILELLNKTVKANWQLLSPFNVGQLEAKAQPMIVIAVKPLTSGNLSLLNPSDNPSAVSFIDRINPNMLPEMGLSVGINQDSNAGTLGGFVTLTRNGKIHRGFLTNYHVVRPSETHNQPDNFLEHLDQFGLSFSRPPTRMIQMESLARMDRNATLTEIDESLESSHTTQSEISSGVQQQELIGAVPPPRILQILEQCELQITELLQAFEVVEDMPIILGEVLLTSGKTLLGNKMMDWAFVELSKDVEDKYFRPNQMFPVAANMMPRLFRRELGSLGGVIAPGGSKLTEFGSLVEGQYCTKRGRTTDITAGICNGPKAFCNWSKSQLARYDHDGNPIDPATESTEEFLILSKKANHPSFEQSSFTADGDSGSFVMDQFGTVTGLLFGRFKQGYAYAGVASSMSDVQESIKLRAGGSASLGLPV